MGEFRPGWYVVQGADAQGRTRLKYFARRDLVTCECYATSDGRQIYVWGAPERPNGMRELWRPSYTFRGTESGGKWDNERTEAKNKASGGGEATATRTTPRSPCEDLSQHCPACDRKGLLIMPLRYAVARSDVPASAAAPPLSGNFATGDDGIALPAGLARYTVRTLRIGYLYVFNEPLGSAGWSGYTVDVRGYLTEFDLEAGAPPALNDKGNAPCGRRPTSEMARCIAIPDAHLPERLGTVWMTFSDTPWTTATLNEHKSKPAVREKNMRAFNAKDWVASKGAVAQVHVETLDAGHAKVAEFSVEESLMERVMRPLHFPWPQGENILMPGAQPAFADSFAPFATASNKLPQLLEGARLASKDVPVAMLALADPTAVATDLNAQIIRRANAWANEPLRRWKRESAQSIDAIETAVRNGAVQRTSNARSTAAGIFGTLFPGHSSGVYQGRTSGEKMDRAGYVNEEEADRIGRREWQRNHVELFNDAAKRHYMDVEHPQELKAFETSTTVPLDEAYRAWMSSPRYRDHFRYNFDTQDLENGLAYVQKVLLALADATGRLSVAKWLVERFADDPADLGSVEIRAFVGNQKAIIDGWVALAKDESIAPGELAWSDAGAQMWSVYGSALDTKAFKALAAGEAVAAGGTREERWMNVIGRYTHQVSGPIVRRLQNLSNTALGWAAAKIPERRLMSMLGGLLQAEHKNLRIIDLTTVATRKQAARMVANTLAGISGGDGHQYRSAIREMLDRYEDARGRTYPYRAFLVINEAEAARLSQMTGSARDLHVSNTVLRYDQFDAAFDRSVRNVFDVKLKVGIVTNILAAFSMSKALEEMNKAAPAERDWKMINFAGGVAALAGGLMDTTGHLLDKTPWGKIAVGRHGMGLKVIGETWETRAATAGGIGKLIGAVGGFIAAAIAFKEGADNIRLAPAYAAIMIVMGVASVIGAILTFSIGFGHIGFIIGLVVALITLVVSLMKPTKVQKWLDASYFGHHKGEKFNDRDEESAALAALGED